MFAELLGFPSGELGRAVNLPHRFQTLEVTIKTLTLAAIRCSLMFLVTGSLFSIRPAEAYTVTLQQIGL